MTRFAEPLAALGLLVALAGCSFADDTLLPALAGQDARAPGSPAASAATPAAATAAAGIGTPPAGNSEVRRLRTDLKRLQDSTGRLDAELAQLREGLAQNDAAYRGLITGIETDRREGAGAGGPKPTTDTTALQAQVAETGDLLSRLSALSARASSEATFSSYLLQAIRAASVRTDLSEGERRQIAGIEGDAARAAASADRVVSATAEQIAEASRRLAAEQREVAGLLGGAAASRATTQGAAPTGAPSTAAPPTGATPAAARAAPRPEERRAFVTIRFDRPDVAYEPALRDAVARARQRRPDVAFDLVAVTPPGASPESAAEAKRNVGSVFRALLGMGVPADRIRISAQTRPEVETQEVRLYVR